MCVEPSGSRTRRAVLPALLAAGSALRAARLDSRLDASMAVLSAIFFASASCAALHSWGLSATMYLAWPPFQCSTLQGCSEENSKLKNLGFRDCGVRRTLFEQLPPQPHAQLLPAAHAARCADARAPGPP